MLSYVTTGANDIQRAKRFYSAFMSALGYGLEETPYGSSYVLPPQPGQLAVSPDYYVKPTFDGRPASARSGAMIAFRVQCQQHVRDLHAAALAAGGREEGQPGFRDAYGPNFYVVYVHNPLGNKIAFFSSNPDEPGRDG